MHNIADNPPYFPYTFLMKPIRVAVVGSRGYSGLELTRILLRHPHVESLGLFASEPFEPADGLPELKAGQLAGLPLSTLLDSPKNYDCAFLALPHEASLKVAPALLAAGLNVIDLSGVFRLQDGDDNTRLQQYEKWYRLKHSELELLKNAQYGLVPFQSVKFSGRPTLVSNPGCYATAISLAIIPLLQAQLLDPQFVAVDAKSGTTGAGKKAQENLLFSEVDGLCLPYRVGHHQHEPEIQMALSRWGGTSIGMSFTPHLLPVRRGIIASVYGKVPSGTKNLAIAQAYQEAYGEYPLVRFQNLEEPGAERELRLSRVVGSPRTNILWKLVDDRLTVFSLLDNLLKGAASQAVENFNSLYGWSGTLGLENKEGLL
jgi:N-acetyl-gamma-glutamyl-phosphate reductase